MTPPSRRAASLLLIVGLSLNARLFANSPEEALSLPRINVRIFNYAEVEKSVFVRSQQEASRILRQCGVEIEWIECAVAARHGKSDPRCTARVEPSDILICILTGEMTGFERHGELGVALVPEGGGFGSRASLFHNRIREYCERWQASQGLLLGHTIAHEIGHLLLGANSHSGGGIMRAPWNRKTIEMAGAGTLLFSAEEAKRMRAQIAERLRTAQTKRAYQSTRPR